MESNDRAAFDQLVLCRRFELLIERLALAGEVRGMAHSGIGQEAIAAGVAPLVQSQDWANGTYRNVSLAVCLKIPLAQILGELLGKAAGLCGGCGGHMHLIDLSHRFVGTDAIVGAPLGLGAGAALSLKQLKQPGVAVTFSGEGALGTGISHEVLNIAKLWSLPSLFIIENNGYSISLPLRDGLAGTIEDRARSYGLRVSRCDGNDLRAVRRCAAEALEYVRQERAPALLEALTWRQRGHSKSDAGGYRSKDDEQKWLARDPVDVFSAQLLRENLLARNDIDVITANADRQLEEALKEARAMPWPNALPSPTKLTVAASAPQPGTGENRIISYREALNEALAEELARDERVIMVGQDVGVFGGAYKASTGLKQRFGARVIDTPIAEQGVCQMLTGAALTGLKPIFEVMFGDFLALCADAIVNHAAKFRFVSGGKVRVPLVIRAPFGPGNGFAATHSQCVERWFAHVPGLIVAVPATPFDVKVMLRAALSGSDPVLLLEPITLYANTGLVPKVIHADAAGLSGARVVEAGSSLTCVSYGRALFAALAAREKLPRPESVEVIDLRCLQPLDRATILASTRKTRNLLVVEDDPRTFGIGAEVIASVIEAGVSVKRALRICGADSPAPFSAPLEAAAFPAPATIQETMQRMLEGASC